MVAVEGAVVNGSDCYQAINSCFATLTRLFRLESRTDRQPYKRCLFTAAALPAQLYSPHEAGRRDDMTCWVTWVRKYLDSFLRDRWVFEWV